MRAVSQSPEVRVRTEKRDPYFRFDAINGDHPLKEALPEGYVEYRARSKPGGRILYFNFALAKEMGLIPVDHPWMLTEKLKEKLLNTFSIQIINEQDVAKKRRFHRRTIKPQTYMATRYLQLQHPSRIGLTSGDGRSIWNGKVTYRGLTWDISSCGTGATRLSPAAAIEKKFFDSGDPNVCYGSGCADAIDGISAAFMSEVFYLNGVETERTLAVIGYKNGQSINVRAGLNLIRPSHLFLHLKQNNKKALRRALNYYLRRQMMNGEFPRLQSEKRRREYFETWIAEVFAQSSAKFEMEYIFCWMDWDGDNILTNGGIIDYGSVRQFGLCHWKYRYDDGDRWSTSLFEQRAQARKTVQVFAQMMDFLGSHRRKKRPLEDFADCEATRAFDQKFESMRLDLLLKKGGLDSKTRQYILQYRGELAQNLFKEYRKLEKVLKSKKVVTTADGTDQEPLFDMRKALRDLPSLLLSKRDPSKADLFSVFKSEDVRSRLRQLEDRHGSGLREFLNAYQQLVEVVTQWRGARPERILLEMRMRAFRENPPHRMTGDAALGLAELYLAKGRGLGFQKKIRLLNRIILSLSSGRRKLNGLRKKSIKLIENKLAHELLSEMFQEIQLRVSGI